MPLLHVPMPAVGPPHDCGLISSSTLPSQSLSTPSHSSAEALQVDIGAAVPPVGCCDGGGVVAPAAPEVPLEELAGIVEAGAPPDPTFGPDALEFMLPTAADPAVLPALVPPVELV
jgi:hypothetical protein